MRNPFRLKNTIEDEAREFNQTGSGIDFEEATTNSLFPERLERGEERRPRGLLLGFLIAVSFFLIFGRLYYLTVAKHEEYRLVAEGNRLRIEYLPAPRGAIYDSMSKVIASNRPSFEVVAYPLDLPKDQADFDGVVGKLAQILEIEPQEIKNILNLESNQSFQSVLIKQNISREQALILHERIQDMPGFRVIDTPIRDYKYPLVFTHLLGYTGKINPEEYKNKAEQGYLYNDTVGKTGLEQIYESFVRGKFGEMQVEVDARGVVKKVFGKKEAIPGNNLYLNLDIELQQKLYQALMRQTGDRKKAAAVVMNPQNGRVLALVSLPSFDNNSFAEGISQQDYQKLLSDKNQPLFNRSVRGTYPPGSTVKPLVAAAALQEKVVSSKTVIEDRGHIVIENIYGGPDYFFYGYNRAGLGSVDVRRAIALSSDIFFYIVGGGYNPVKITGLGIDKLAEYYRKFRIGQTLGIDLPAESAGLIPTPDWKAEQFADDPVNSRWFLGNTYHVSIGQGDLLATPLHVLSWTATISNGGRIWKPFIVERVEDNEGKVLKKLEPEVIGEIGIDEEYLRVVAEGMRQTVTEGTARSLNTLSIAVAGKTGTAQFDARNLNRTHAWFAGYAPFENPEIAIVVLVEDGGEGSSAAVPVAREVLDWWAKNRYQR